MSETIKYLSLPGPFQLSSLSLLLALFYFGALYGWQFFLIVAYTSILDNIYKQSIDSESFMMVHVRPNNQLIMWHL